MATMMTSPVRSKRPGVLVGAAAALSAALFALAPAMAPAQQPITISFATIAPENTPWEKQLRQVKDYWEKQSGGRVKVRLFMGGALGGEKALVRRCSQGTLQAIGVSTASAASMAPELNLIELPYLFDSERQADQILDNVLKNELRGLLAKRGFVFALWAENGFRSMYTKDRPIKGVGDIKGLRMRSQESSVHLDTYRALGASPVPIDAPNVLTSLQTGVIDGFDNTPLYAFATSWYQAAHHLVLSEHIYQPAVILLSKSWFDGLPADLRQILTSVPQNIVQDGRDGVRALNPILLRNLEKAGVQITRLNDAQRREFAEKTRSVHDAFVRQTGAEARRLLRLVQQAKQRYH